MSLNIENVDLRKLASSEDYQFVNNENLYLKRLPFSEDYEFIVHDGKNYLNYSTGFKLKRKPFSEDYEEYITSKNQNIKSGLTLQRYPNSSLYQVVTTPVLTSLGSSFNRISNTSSYGFIYCDRTLKTYVVNSLFAPFKIFITDGSGDYANSYLSSLGSGLTTTNQWTSNFSAGADGVTAGNGAVDGNIDGIGGEDNTCRFTVDATNDTHYLRKNTIFTLGALYRVRNDYYIPSANSNITDLRLFDGSGYITSTGDLDTQDAWTSHDKYWTAINTRIQFFAQDNGAATFQDAGGDDVFYIKNDIIDRVDDIPANRGANTIKTVNGTIGWNDPDNIDFNSIAGGYIQRSLT